MCGCLFPLDVTVKNAVVEIRIRNWLAFFEDGTFCRLFIAQNVRPTKIDFGWPYVETGRKMADGCLLFLALKCIICTHIIS